MSISILNVVNVSKQYGNQPALDDVSITVPEQSVYGLLGPNGAGKTTLIRIINQILGADTGAVFLNGLPMERKHVAQIGYLPEERGLYRKMKVGEHLMYLAELKGMNRSLAKRELAMWHERLETGSWQNKKVEELSKGMQQKIQFIATVVHNPRLLILDEPFTGFDPINSRVIKREIERLRDAGTSIILSTHRMESVEEMCTHMAFINKARKIKEGTIKEVRRDFISNTYKLQFAGELPAGFAGGKFNILNHWKCEDGLFHAEVQMINGYSPNDILQELLPFVEVHNFNEVIPSVNDIFISLVNGNLGIHEKNLADHTA